MSFSTRHLSVTLYVMVEAPHLCDDSGACFYARLRVAEIQTHSRAHVANVFVGLEQRKSIMYTELSFSWSLSKAFIVRNEQSVTYVFQKTWSSRMKSVGVSQSKRFANQSFCTWFFFRGFFPVCVWLGAWGGGEREGGRGWEGFHANYFSYLRSLVFLISDTVF